MKLAFAMMALITSISFVGAVKAVVKINETNISVDNNLFTKYMIIKKIILQIMLDVVL